MQVLSILHLVRSHNLLIAVTAALIGAFLLDFSFSYSVLQCLIIITTTMSLGYIMNDLIDIKTDSINHPHRPLVTKKTSHRVIIVLSSVLLLLLLLFSYTLNHISAKFLYFYIIPLLIFYNIFFKKTPLIGNIIVSFAIGAVFVFVELVLTGSFNQLITPFFLTFSFSMLREMIKDTEDYKGDLSSGMLTLPILVGMTKMRYLIIILIACLMIGLPLPYFLYNYNILYLFLLLIFIEIPLIYSLFLLIKFPNQNTYKRLADIFKILCIGGLIIIMSTKTHYNV